MDCVAWQIKLQRSTVFSLSVAAGAGEVTNLGFDDLTFMQDMTSATCESASEGDTKRLYDIRDGNKYWIAKLKDGNCWMTQNLAYDDSAATASLPSAWGSDNAARKYYNPGLYVYTAPTNSSNSCGDGNGLKNCTSKGWTNVTGWTASDDPNYAGVVDTTNKIYDAHYLAGNYYSYVAATAGSAPSAAGTAPSSICPSGWQLPTSNNTNSKSFGGLFAAYGSLSGLNAGTQDIRLAPLYFVYGGSVYNSSLYSAGELGRYWSSTANSASNAYNLAFDTSVTPSNSNNRYLGYSVRCVAR